MYLGLQTFGLLALAAQFASVVATPPACLLGAVNQYQDPSDISSVCKDKDATNNIAKSCGGNTQAALSAFSDLCNAKGVQVSTNVVASSTAASTAAASSSVGSSSGAQYSASTSARSSASNSARPSASQSVTNSARPSSGFVSSYVVVSSGSSSPTSGSGVSANATYAQATGTPAASRTSTATPVLATGAAQKFGMSFAALAVGLGAMVVGL